MKNEIVLKKLIDSLFFFQNTYNVHAIVESMSSYNGIVSSSLRYKLPQQNCVGCIAGKRFAIWRKPYRTARYANGKGGLVFAGISIPQPDCLIITPTGKCTAIWRKRYRIDKILTVFMGCFEFPCAGLP